MKPRRIIAIVLPAAVLITGAIAAQGARKVNVLLANNCDSATHTIVDCVRGGLYSAQGYGYTNAGVYVCDVWTTGSTTSTDPGECDGAQKHANNLHDGAGNYLLSSAWSSSWSDVKSTGLTNNGAISITDCGSGCSSSWSVAGKSYGTD